MDDENLLTIGAMAQRTGLSVKTIRFYADKGIVPPTCHSPTGHRLYDMHALARLELVRTLRELDIDLATIRRVLAREPSLAEVAAAHVSVLDVQVRTLRLRRWMLERLEVADDSRVGRYRQLVVTVNGLPAGPDMAPVFAWFAAALRAHTEKDDQLSDRR